MNKIFKGFLGIYFQIGVNVIGIPDIHIHKLSIYKTINTQNYGFNGKIIRVNGGIAAQTPKPSNVKRFGKTSREFRQD